MHNAYINYKRRYRAKAKLMEKKGLKMASERLNRSGYEMARAMAVNDGIEININQTIVSRQQYEYTQDVARRFKRVAAEHSLEWQDLTITQIRKGAVDVSAINEMLKENYPDMTGKQRAKWISHEVFGSE